MWKISGFRREVDENCALLGYYAAYRDNSLPTFRDILVLSSRVFLNLLTREDRTDSLSRNDGKELPLYIA
jgi:hypothetical protein